MQQAGHARDHDVRGDVDDGATATCAQVRHRRAAAVPDALHIDREHAVPRLLGDFLEGAAGSRNQTGVVD